MEVDIGDKAVEHWRRGDIRDDAVEFGRRGQKGTLKKAAQNVDDKRRRGLHLKRPLHSIYST